MNGFARLETELFRALNRFIEPAVLAGCASPGILPMGVVLLETTGRRTGRPHRTPLIAGAVGEHLLVSTVRGRRSNWVENVKQDARVRYWSGREPRDATAVLFAPDTDAPGPEALPSVLRWNQAGLAWLAGDLGCAVAVLSPARVG